MKVTGVRRGFTLVELAVIVAIVGILAALGIQGYLEYMEKTRATIALFDINSISKTLQAATLDNPDELPADQAVFTAFCATSGLPINDPWKNPYRYYRTYGLTRQEINKDATARKKGPFRPLNYDYDLYSMGPDGESKPALSAKVSRDDIMRADEGAFIGKASSIPLEE